MAVLRAGTVADVMALQGPQPARLARQLMRQMHRSDLFALEDGAGQLVAAGGLYPYDDDPLLECWLVVAPEGRLKPRALVEACYHVLERAAGERHIVALTRAGAARDARFLRFLGFKLQRSEPLAILGVPHHVHLWSP